MKIIAQLIGSKLVVEATLRKTWRVDPRRPRRHLRRKGTFRTLCGRWARDVLLARPGAKYPLDRPNCKTCGEASFAKIADAFEASYRRLTRGEVSFGDAEAEFSAAMKDLDR